ncbi:hypothetical protein GCM10025777_58900 [Membranihabitans marinus]
MVSVFISCGKEDIEAESTSIIADYPLISHFDDVSGNNPAINQQNVVFEDQSIFIDGNYLWDDDTGSVLWTSVIEKWDLDDFKISLDFKLVEWPQRYKPILVLGNSKRWGMISVSPLGFMNSAFHDIPPQKENNTIEKVETNEWHKLLIEYSSDQSRFEVYLNDNRVILKENFQIIHGGDQTLAAHHGGLGIIFHGNWKNLKIY